MGGRHATLRGGEEEDDHVLEEKLPENTLLIRIKRPTMDHRHANESPEDAERVDSSKRGRGSRKAPTCPECGKSFPSDKSLFGHLRCHPERNYRGVNPPPPKTLPETKWPTAKRGRKRLPEAHSEDDDPEAAAANILLLLAADAQHQLPIPQASNFDDKSDGKDNSLWRHKRDNKTKTSDESAAASPRSRRYQCSLCSKTFASHQALGGHRASHNKNKGANIEEAPVASEDDGEGAAQAEHRCKCCNMTFATGQALGGHQRRHFNEQLARARSSTSSSSETPAEDCKGFDFDLNEKPREEE